MCGFAGELRFDQKPADLGALSRMNERMRARGPDGGGSFQRGSLGLAHRRLTIIDLSNAGEQPMVDSELGLSLVFNGCIYNYRQLRSELQTLGYRFFSNSDTEVILKNAARGLLPAKVIDRPKGYFPVPGIRHIEGDLLELVKDALTSSAACDRGLFDAGYLGRILDEPNTLRSNLGSNALWQAGLLELWLQEMKIA